MKKIAILMLGLILLDTVCFAEDIYIAQNSAGSANGTSCSNAYAATWFNASGNWQTSKIAGKIGSGDTVHLCGTISTQLATKAAGSSGSVITILFENDAMFSAPTWTVRTGAITINNNYITLDGGTNGIIQATDNGTPISETCYGSPCGWANTFDYYNDISGVYINRASYVTVQNLTIQKIYDRTNSADCITSAGEDIEISGNSNNIVINHNTLSDGRFAVYGILTNTSNITVSNNTIRNTGTGINISPGNTSSTGTNINVFGNNIQGNDKYNGQWNIGCDTTLCGASCASDLWFHQDGMHFYGQGTNAIITGLYIYNNYLQDFGTHSTAHIYLESLNAPSIVNSVVYNNICINTGDNYASNGMITLKSVSGTQIFNNTLIGNYPAQTNTGIYFNDSIGAPPKNVVIKNNIISSVSTILGWVNGSTWTADYNDLYGYNASYFSEDSSNNYYTLSWWLGQGYDAHGIHTNPDLNYNYTEKSSSPTRGAGTNLTSLGIATLNTDFTGNPRPSSGAWDIGAYESHQPSPPGLY